MPQVNVKKTKMMICDEDAENVIKKGADCDSIFCHFCSFRVHRICSGIKGKIKEDSKFRWHMQKGKQI